MNQLLSVQVEGLDCHLASKSHRFGLASGGNKTQRFLVHEGQVRGRLIEARIEQ